VLASPLTMFGLLFEFQELCAWAQNADRSLRLPYTIANDRASNFSVSLGDDAEWTAAMKAVLTVLKWLLAWVTRTPQQGVKAVPFGTMHPEAGIRKKKKK